MKKKYFTNKRFDEYGNRIEHVNSSELNTILNLKKRHSEKIEQIKSTNKCFGDKVRDIMKQGITQNTVYARKLLEMI
jgi:hypothetical protein